MAKGKDGDKEKIEEKFLQVREFVGKIDRAVWHGVMQQEGWHPNTEVTVAEFEKAVARFTAS